MPPGNFETWLLRRVAQAVEAGEMSAGLLAELRREIEQTGDLSQAEGHALAVQDIAERVGLPVDQAKTMLATLESQPTVTREILLRQFVEAWLVHQREMHHNEIHGD